MKTTETELLLIRHGQTVWNLEGRWQGQLESPLTDLGIAQAKAIANRLRNETFSALYASDLSRAYDTATPIGAMSGHEIVIDQRLRERNGGVLQGLHSEDAQRLYPEAYQAFQDRVIDYVVQDGESTLQLRDRAIEVFAELAERHRGERIVAVSHGALISVFLRHVMEIPHTASRRFAIPNTSLTIMTYHHEDVPHSGPGWMVKTLSETAHLRGLDG